MFSDFNFDKALNNAKTIACMCLKVFKQTGNHYWLNEAVMSYQNAVYFAERKKLNA